MTYQRLLSDPDLASSCRTRAKRMASLRKYMESLSRILESLGSKPYAGEVEAVWSHAGLFLERVPELGQKQESANTAILCIEPNGNGFSVGCRDSSDADWDWRKCQEEDLVELIDEIITQSKQ